MLDVEYQIRVTTTYSWCDTDNSHSNISLINMCNQVCWKTRFTAFFLQDLLSFFKDTYSRADRIPVKNYNCYTQHIVKAILNNIKLCFFLYKTTVMILYYDVLTTFVPIQLEQTGMYTDWTRMKQNTLTNTVPSGSRGLILKNKDCDNTKCIMGRLIRLLCGDWWSLRNVRQEYRYYSAAAALWPVSSSDPVSVVVVVVVVWA